MEVSWNVGWCVYVIHWCPQRRYVALVTYMTSIFPGCMMVLAHCAVH